MEDKYGYYTSTPVLIIFLRLAAL